MSTFDIVLVVVIAAFGLLGLKFGLVHTVGSLLGTIVGVYLSSRYYTVLANALMKYLGVSGQIATVVSFIVAFIIINRLVGLAFYLIDKTLGVITSLPFIHGIDRLLGLLFGLIEGILVAGISLYFITKFPLGPGFMQAINVSRLASVCIAAASILWPFIPQALKSLQAPGL